MRHLRRSLLLASALAAFVSCAQAQVSPGGVQGVRASGSSGYPPGATAVGADNTATTGGISNLALPISATQFTYLCGFSVGIGTATTAITVNVTLTNIPGGPFTWPQNAPATAATATAGPVLTQTFSPCVRSNVINQSPSLSIGALGAGGVSQTANMWGYNQ